MCSTPGQNLLSPCALAWAAEIHSLLLPKYPGTQTCRTRMSIFLETEAIPFQG